MCFFFVSGKQLLMTLRTDLESIPPEKRADSSLQLFWTTGPGSSIGMGALKPLARAYFSAPATSVSSERAWSSAGFIYNETRARMTSENITKLVTIRDRLQNLTSLALTQAFMVEAKEGSIVID